MSNAESLADGLHHSILVAPGRDPLELDLQIRKECLLLIRSGKCNKLEPILTEIAQRYPDASAELILASVKSLCVELYRADFEGMQTLSPHLITAVEGRKPKAIAELARHRELCRIARRRTPGLNDLGRQSAHKLGAFDLSIAPFLFLFLALEVPNGFSASSGYFHRCTPATSSSAGNSSSAPLAKLSRMDEGDASAAALPVGLCLPDRATAYLPGCRACGRQQAQQTIDLALTCRRHRARDRRRPRTPFCPDVQPRGRSANRNRISSRAHAPAGRRT